MLESPHFNPGKLEVYTGPMRSGKTRELLNRVDKISYVNGYNVLLVKPKVDTRDQDVKTRFGSLSFPCKFIDEDKPEKILNLVKEKEKVIAIDETHFFSSKIIEVVEKLLDQDRNVLIAGLDLNFRGEVFGSMGELLARADEVNKLKAVCCYKNCDQPATRTQRLVNGEPAPYDAPLVLIGDDKEGYEPRCLNHHKVPGKD